MDLLNKTQNEGTKTAIMSQISRDNEGMAILGPFLQCSPGVGEPEHVANAALFLATAPSVNGAELTVDNGWTAT